MFLLGFLCSSVRTRFNLHVVKTSRVLDKIEGQLYDSVFALSSGRVTSIGAHGEFNWQVWGRRREGEGRGGKVSGREVEWRGGKVSGREGEDGGKEGQREQCGKGRVEKGGS